jgi:hypothetical protein
MTDEHQGKLRLIWRTLGTARIDSKGKLKLPITSGPNVYRFSVENVDGLRHEYIGETEDLERRFFQYRNPGRSQWTNRRLNRMLTDVLAAGGKVHVDIVDDGWIEYKGTETRANFWSKNTRRLF